MFPTPRTALAATLLALLGAPALFAQTGGVQDVAPVNAAQMLQDLKQIGSKRGTELATLKTQAYQQAVQLAASPANAMAAYQNAVQATEFQGLSKDAAQFRDWKDKMADAMKNPQIATALHLYFNWLALTLQHSSGTAVKDMLPAIISHAHEAITDQSAMDAFEETLRRDKDVTSREPQPGAARRNITKGDVEKSRDDGNFKRLHDQIVNNSLGNSAYVQWQHLEEVVNDVAPVKKRGDKADLNQTESSWTSVPGDVDAIYANIILPELRAQRDPRAIEYWDAKLRREADVATRSKLQFQIDQFNNEVRPGLLWSRAQEFEWIGMKNRAATEMFNVIKTSPASPATAGWIVELQNLLAPKPAAASQGSAASTGVAPPPLPGAQ